MKYTIVSDGDYGAVYDSASGRKLQEGSNSELEHWLRVMVAYYFEVPVYFEDTPIPHTLDEALMLQLPEDDES